MEFPAVLCPLPSPATRAVVWFNSFQVSEYWSELFQFHRPQFGAIEGRLGCLWTISGWGDNRELRVGPQDWLVQVYAWDWTGEGLGRNSVLGLARTHKTISYPLRQTRHVPPPSTFQPRPAGATPHFWNSWSGSPDPTGSIRLQGWPRVLTSPEFWWG